MRGVTSDMGSLMARWRVLACLSALALVSAVCATASRADLQTLRITTDPPHATVFINGANMGPSPARVEVKPRESSVSVTVVCAGYEDAHVEVKRRTSGWIASNFPLTTKPKMHEGAANSSGAALGLAAAAVILTAIDRETGSAGHLDPVAVHVALVKR